MSRRRSVFKVEEAVAGTHTKPAAVLSSLHLCGHGNAENVQGKQTVRPRVRKIQTVQEE